MTLAPALDVLIVGAGPVGMSAAAELIRQGLSVRIVERRSGPTTDTRAPVLWPRTQELYAAMGLLPKFQAKAVVFNDMDVYAYHKYLGHYRYDDSDSPHGMPLILTQGLIEGILRDHLQDVGCPVEDNIEAGNFAQDAQGVTATLRHANGRAEDVRASYLIGADGGRSPVRGAFGLDFPTEPYEGFQIRIADGHIRWSHPQGGRGYFFIHEGAYLGFNPLPPFPDGRERGYCYMLTPDTDPDNRAMPTEEELQGVIRELSGDRGATLSDLQWTNRLRFRHGFASTFRRGRVFLMGDAAKVIIPIGGQGMNTGIQDAYNLAWKLAAVHHGSARPGLLDSYSTERRAVAQVVTEFTAGIFRLATQPKPVRIWGMRNVGPLAFRLRAVQRWQAQQQTELNIQYPVSPLTRDHGGRGLKAGRRAPDAMLVRLPGRETVKLFDLYDGKTWNLLLFSGSSPDAATLGALNDLSARLNTGPEVPLRTTVIVPGGGMAGSGPAGGLSLSDTEGEAHRRYGVSEPRLYLVRPDGYVGFRGALQDAPDLAAYLDEVFPVGSGERQSALEAFARRVPGQAQPRAAFLAAAGLALGGAALLAARRARP